VAVLLVDHQAGLISLAQDVSPGEFKNNVLALADIARRFPHGPEGSQAGHDFPVAGEDAWRDDERIRTPY
jgi:hypothetical protein